MTCPECDSNCQVIDSRQEGETRRRRHLCGQCSHRFTTYEISAELYDKIRAVSVDISQFDSVIAFLRKMKVQFGKEHTNGNRP